MKTTSWKLCALNLFVGSDFTFGRPFKVKLVLATLNAFPLLSLVL